MKAVKILAIFLVSVFLSTQVHAKDIKIAYVALGGVFNTYQKTKEFDNVLQKESQEAQKKIDDMLTKIRDAQGKLALLKEDEKQKLQVNIDKQKADLLEFQKQKRAELGKKFDDMRKEIILEIEKVVSDIAKKDGYTFILNDTVLLYGDKEADITEKVLKALNDNYSKK